MISGDEARRREILVAPEPRLVELLDDDPPDQRPLVRNGENEERARRRRSGRALQNANVAMERVHVADRQVAVARQAVGDVSKDRTRGVFARMGVRWDARRAPFLKGDQRGAGVEEAAHPHAVRPQERSKGLERERERDVLSPLDELTRDAAHEVVATCALLELPHVPGALGDVLDRRLHDPPPVLELDYRRVNVGEE